MPKKEQSIIGEYVIKHVMPELLAAGHSRDDIGVAFIAMGTAILLAHNKDDLLMSCIKASIETANR